MQEQLSLLGVPKLSEPLPLEKPFSLLYYLAYQAKWVSRDALAFLYRPDATKDVAQAHLRKLIHRVKDIPWAASLEVERSRLRFVISTDTHFFKEACEQENWSEALRLYTGEFLQGVSVNDAIGYSEWLELERQTLFRLWRTAVLKESERLLELSPLEASEHLGRLVKADPLDEEALQLYLQTLLKLEKRTEALRAYELFQEMLKRDLASEPLASTQALIQAFHEKTVKAEPARAVLPYATTHFVGREQDLELVLEHLQDAACRLLTLTGSGGIGKSRLALEAAHQLAVTQDVFFVDLSAISSSTAFVPSIAEGMGITLTGQLEPLEQLKRHIGTRPVLLVLDMFEHLLSVKHDLLALLTACPQLKLLISSRERLNLEGEWVLALDGLRFPESASNLAELSKYDAAELFMQTARQNKLNRVFSDADVNALLNICKQVGGSPLGLQLAASWLRAMPLADIAVHLKKNLNLLKDDSLRAVFARSWDYLSLEEKNLLIKLCVFQGGLNYQAGLDVSDASLSLIIQLLDKSMLFLSNEGRYDFHPLIRSYVTEEAQQATQLFHTAKEKHGRYFMHMLASTGEQLHQHEQLQALATLERELSNIRAAWQWCVNEKRVSEMFDACEQLYWFFTLQGRFAEALEMIHEALPAYDASQAEHRGVLGRLLMAQASCLGRMNSSDEAVMVSERSIELLDESDDALGKMACRITLSAILWRKGDYQEAHKRIKEAKKLHTSDFSKRWQGQLLGMQALIEAGLGKRVQAMISFQRALNINKQIGNSMQSVVALFGVGSALLNAGKLRQADSMLSQALKLAQDINYQAFQAVIMTSLAQLKLSRRAYKQTEQLAKTMLKASDHSGDQVAQADAFILLGRAAIAQQLNPAGQTYLIQGLSLAQELDNKLASLRALLGFAEYYLNTQQTDTAAEILRSLQTEAPEFEKARAEKLLLGLALQANRSTQDLNALAEQLLSKLANIPNEGIPLLPAEAKQTAEQLNS